MHNTPHIFRGMRARLQNNPLCGLILGKLAYKRGERDHAIRLLKSAVGAFPDDAEAFYLLGFACDKAGNRQEASRALAKGVGLAPGSPYAAEAKKILDRKN
jgi:Flp pilus assembly protein TadD